MVQLNFGSTLMDPRAEPTYCAIMGRGFVSLAESNRMTSAKCAWSAVCHGHPVIHELLLILKFSSYLVFNKLRAPALTNETPALSR